VIRVDKGRKARVVYLSGGTREVIGAVTRRFPK
jgi:hypothetical protein